MDSIIIKNAIWGAIIGDCLGVPVEFQSRDELKENPVEEMLAYGTYHKPAGTWSDDTSLILATMDAPSMDIKQMAKNFVDWRYFDKYCQNKMFDIGTTTSISIAKISSELSCGTFKEDVEYGIASGHAGNGSLMRIIPVALYLYEKNFDETTRRELVYKISALTHADILCKTACVIYVEYVIELLNLMKQHENEKNIKLRAYDNAISQFKNISPEFKHLMVESKKFIKIPERKINSTGYVVDTLTASLWCFMNSSSYEEAVLKAVNLGNDTDTTACVTGGIAGIMWGVPDEWLDEIYNKDEAENIIKKFCEELC